VFVLGSVDQQPAQHRLDVLLGQGLALRGYDLEPTGTAYRLTLTWECLDEVDMDYTVFLHEVDGGQIVAQHDQYPLGGFFPTSMWATGNTVHDSYALSFCTDDAEVRVGLYDADSRTRLQRADSELDYVIIRCAGHQPDEKRS